MEQNKINTHIKRGVIWTTINRLSVILVQFIAMMVLARYISPSDFAVMGIIMFFISISNILTDSGMGGSLIYKKDVKSIDYDTLFVYNLLVGIFMYVLFICFSGTISRFYNISELSSIINVIGISIVINALGKIQNTILVKELRFKELGLISIISSVLSLLCAVILAILGYGVWALVVQNLVQASMLLLLQFYFNRYIPKLRFSKEAFKEQWAFGVHLFLSSGLHTIYNNIFLIIFPKISTLNFSGLYSQASRLQQVPISVFTEVVNTATFPVLSKIEDPEQFKEVNRALSRKLYLIMFSCFLLLSLLSKPIIEILLGDKWISAAPILSIICCAGIGLMIMVGVRNTLKSLSKTKQIFRLEICKAIIGFFVLLLSIPFGDLGVIWGILIASVLSSIIAIVLLAKHSNYSVYNQISDIFSALIITLPSFVVSFLLFRFFVFSNLLSIIIGIVVFVGVTIMIGICLRNKEITQLLKKIKL